MNLKNLLPKSITKNELEEEQAKANAKGQTTTVTYSNNTSSASANLPYGISDGSAITTTAGYPNYLPPSNNVWTTTVTGGWTMSDTAEFKKLKCALPESTLEKLMMIGLPKSKKVLKQRVQEEFTKWCNTGEIDVSVFPMLLAACVVFLSDEDETTKKEEK